MEFQPIGFAETCFHDKFGTPRQPHIAPDTHGILHLNPTLNPHDSLRALEGFSHLWIIFAFDAPSNPHFCRATVAPPRLGGKRVGVFATRTPRRPNPIGLSLVKIEKIMPPRIYFSGCDIISGTAILDIKPYIQSSDSVLNSKQGWLDQVSSPSLTVEFSLKSQEQLSAIPNGNSLKNNITAILAEDIRTQCDKRRQEPEKVFGFYIDSFNVRFHVSETCIHVMDIEPMCAQ